MKNSRLNKIKILIKLNLFYIIIQIIINLLGMSGTVYRFGRQQTRNEDVEIEYYEVLKPGATKSFVFLVGLMSHA
jgi:hypothetical protein